MNYISLFCLNLDSDFFAVPLKEKSENNPEKDDGVLKKFLVI